MSPAALRPPLSHRGSSASSERRNQDAFVTKIGPSGNTLIYSTYLGGSGGARLHGSCNQHRRGLNRRSICHWRYQFHEFPCHRRSFPTDNMGEGDAFVSKLNPAGTALVYSTYLGGSSVDSASGIAVDFSATPTLPATLPPPILSECACRPAMRASTMPLLPS